MSIVGKRVEVRYIDSVFVRNEVQPHWWNRFAPEGYGETVEVVHRGRVLDRQFGDVLVEWDDGVVGWASAEGLRIVTAQEGL